MKIDHDLKEIARWAFRSVIPSEIVEPDISKLVTGAIHQIGEASGTIGNLQIEVKVSVTKFTDVVHSCITCAAPTGAYHKITCPKHGQKMLL